MSEALPAAAVAAAHAQLLQRAGEPGEWQNFYDQIEGFSHQPGTRNVLRVNRYTVANPPADGSSQAFVLDMVVESDGRGSK